VEYAFPPQAVTVTLEDEIDVSRGDMIVHRGNIPKIDRHIEAMLVWMDEKPMDPNTRFFIKQTTNTTKAAINTIRYKVDINTLEKSETDHLSLNEIAKVIITTNKPLFFDPYKKNRSTGSFILIDPVTHNTAAVGMIIDRFMGSELNLKITGAEKEKIIKGESLIKRKELQKRYTQKGVTIWITGLHGCGKNELAYSLERRLFDSGATTVLLDGKSTRAGLSKELDYSPADRAEHLRRIAHISRLLNDQGIITICSFVSPDESIREQLGEIIGKNNFHLIYLEADVEYCRKNDQYGLYDKADAGELSYLPGIDMDFQVPLKPDIIFKPAEKEINTETVIEYLAEKGIFPI
jgi:adenylyl-sulfate kinase